MRGKTLLILGGALAEDLNSNLEEVYVRPKLPLNIYRRGSSEKRVGGGII